MAVVRAAQGEPAVVALAESTESVAPVALVARVELALQG